MHPKLVRACSVQTSISLGKCVNLSRRHDFDSDHVIEFLRDQRFVRCSDEHSRRSYIAVRPIALPHPLLLRVKYEIRCQCCLVSHPLVDVLERVLRGACKIARVLFALSFRPLPFSLCVRQLKLIPGRIVVRQPNIGSEVP